jgi:hypothetical protein
MRLIIFAIALFLIPQTVFSETKKKSYSKTQEVNFDAANVDGTARTPDGAFLNPKKGAKFLPLYKVRDNFSKNIKESTQYLR